MLPKKNRLQKEQDFRSVFREGRAARLDGLLLKIGALKGETTRVGIVVSKKIAGRAVQRNQIRRALSEALRRELERMKSGHDIALVVLPGFRLTEPGDTERKVQGLLRKASLI